MDMRAAREIGDGEFDAERGVATGRTLPIARLRWRRGLTGRRATTPLEALDGLKRAGAPAPLPAHERVARDRFEDVAVRLDPTTSTYWCTMQPSARPSYTPQLLRGLSAMQRSLVRLFEEAPADGPPPFRYFVVRSGREGVFNLGGDLGLFAEKIRAGDRAGLTDYATACIEVVYSNWMDYGLPIVTIGLVQGDALGGGFEAALSCDVVVAEKGVKFGFPEVLFNLFPGMGAFSFLSRKIDGVAARAMVESGRLYEAEELAEMGLVDVLAEPGRGQEAVEAFIAKNRKRHNAHAAMHAAARRAVPLSFTEMTEIVELWVDAAMQLEPGDLRKMERLVGAQDRRQDRVDGAALEAERAAAAQAAE